MPIPLQQMGFTLVEIMVVIVILTIVAGMLTLSIGASENRRNLAFYAHLQSNLRYIRLLSAEQMQPFGVAIKPPQGDTAGQIVVLKLNNASPHSLQASLQHSSDIEKSTSDNTAPNWQPDTSISPLDIPPNLQLDIVPLDSSMQDTAASNANNMPLSAWFTGQNAPPVIWFGTGEVTPVKIILHTTNPATTDHNNQAQYLVSNPIIVNAAGAVAVSP